MIVIIVMIIRRSSTKIVMAEPVYGEVGDVPPLPPRRNNDNHIYFEPQPEYKPPSVSNPMYDLLYDPAPRLYDLANGSITDSKETPYALPNGSITDSKETPYALPNGTDSKETPYALATLPNGTDSKETPYDLATLPNGSNPMYDLGTNPITDSKETPYDLATLPYGTNPMYDNAGENDVVEMYIDVGNE